ncbi:MAG: hypothetical protein EBY20_10740 [Alphaproteobacteria bacterium]|jgi:hypothetical protein|nr:hypothetical protein [Alphaproteobacteria bacterium]
MSKPKKDITPEESAQVESLAAHGHTQREIAYFLKIPYRTFQRKLKEDSLLMTSWRRGRFKGKEYVLSRLMRFIKNDELNAVNLNAIQFYLRNTGFGVENNDDNNELQVSFGNKSALEIMDSTLTALEEREIGVSKAQQLTSLALAKLNIENNGSKDDQAVYQQRSRAEALEFAAKMKEARENLRLINESNTKAN